MTAQVRVFLVFLFLEFLVFLFLPGGPSPVRARDDYPRAFVPAGDGLGHGVEITLSTAEEELCFLVAEGAVTLEAAAVILGTV